MAVYYFLGFLVLVIGFYFRPENYDWVYFQGVPPPDYDYFLLVLQWPPSFCNTGGKTKCREQDFSHFTIHGLWPQNIRNGTEGPAFDLEKLRSDRALINCMKESWPNLIGLDVNFWTHEWDRHGRDIGLDQNSYFKKACSMKENASLDETFARDGILKGNSYPIEKYREAIEKNLGVKVTQRLQCNNRSPNAIQQLLEARLCVHKSEAKFQQCPSGTTIDDPSFPCKGSSPISFPTWP